MHPTEIAELDYLRALKDRLDAAVHGGAGALIEAAMQRLCLSKARVYDRLKNVGWESGRKARSDRGKSAVTVEEVYAVAGIMSAPTRMNGKHIMDCVEAIEIALANGVLHTRVASNTMMRLMKQHGVHPDQLDRPTPHTSMRTEHPNQVWQVDPSLCVLYYLHDGRMRVMERDEFYKNKLENTYKIANDRVLRYVLTDHCSGAFICRYYQTAGEDTETLFDFLMHAMHRRDGFVMHGVPHALVWDAGSANKSHAIKSLLSALAVAHWAHIPGNPRAKGQVEQCNNLVETKFEGRLIFEKIESTDQLNAELDAWQIDFNATRIHSRHHHTRWGAWQMIQVHELRLPPAIDVCRNLLNCKPESRKVAGALTIQFAVRGYVSMRYSVKDVPGVRVHDDVMVTVNPYRAPNVFVIHKDAQQLTRYIECEPIEEDRFGFNSNAPVFGQGYAAHPDCDVDTARKDLREAAWGERSEQDAKAARKKGRVAFDGAIDPFKDVHDRKGNVPAFMPRRGTELDVPNPVQIELRPLDHVTAMKEIRARLDRALTPEDNANVRAWYPDGVPETDLDELVQRLVAPALETPPVRAALQLVR